MKKLLFLSLVLAIGFTAFSQSYRVSRNKYVPVVQNYIPDFDNLADYDEFMYWDGSRYRTVGGKFHIVHYQAKDGFELSATKIHRFYDKLMESKSNAVVLYSGKSNPKDRNDDLFQSVYRFDVGNRQVWVQILTLEQGKEYEIVEIEGRERLTNLSASDLKSTLDSLGSVNVYINFDVNRYNIRPESELVVQEVATLLLQNPNLELLIEGHTDNTGTASRNKALSLQRANEVKNALVNYNIDPLRLTSVGMGQEKPISENNTEAGRAKNRRVVLVKK